MMAVTIAIANSRTVEHQATAQQVSITVLLLGHPLQETCELIGVESINLRDSCSLGFDLAMVAQRMMTLWDAQKAKASVAATIAQHERDNTSTLGRQRQNDQVVHQLQLFWKVSAIV